MELYIFQVYLCKNESRVLDRNLNSEDVYFRILNCVFNGTYIFKYRYIANVLLIKKINIDF